MRRNRGTGALVRECGVSSEPPVAAFDPRGSVALDCETSAAVLASSVPATLSVGLIAAAVAASFLPGMSAEC